MLVMGWAHAARAEVPGWTLGDVGGSVDVQKDGQSTPGTKGALLADGASIATGRDGHVVLRRAGDEVTLSGNSRLRLSDAARLVAEQGNMNCRFAMVAGPPMTVATPYLSARTQGGGFSVSVTRVGATVQVKEGATMVATLDGGAARSLGAGTIGIVSAAEPWRLIIDGAARGMVLSPNAPAAMRETAPPALSAKVKDGAVEIASVGF
jgi:hypothetical protein